MKSDDEVLGEVARNLAEQRKAQPAYQPKRPAPVVPAAMSVEREAELDRRKAHATRLERESRIAHGLRQLEQQRGSRYVGCRLSNFEMYADRGDAAEQQRVVAELAAYCRDAATHAADAYGVFLYGPCGTGKDHLAMAVARAIIQATAEPAKWVCGPDFYREIRDSFDGKKSEGQVLSPYMAAPLLWLSDPLPVTGEPLKEYQATDLYGVIERRYSNRRPTIITANLRPGEADEKFGPAIARRLRETTLMLHCNWPSYRKG